MNRSSSNAYFGRQRSVADGESPRRRLPYACLGAIDAYFIGWPDTSITTCAAEVHQL